MGRILKILLGAVAAIVSLLVIAVLIVALTFDPNDYKDELVAAVEERTGRSLDIDGDIGLSLFPVLAIDVGRVRLSNAPAFDSTTEFLSFEQARVSIRVLPALLRREIRMGNVVVDTLAVNLAVNRQGVANWQDLAEANADAPAPDEGAADGMTMSALEVAGLDIRNASLAYIDREADSEYRLSNLELVSGKVASGQPISLSGGFAFDAQPAGLAGDMSVELTADFNDEVITLTGTALSADVSGIADVPVRVALSADSMTANVKEQTLSPGRLSLKAMDVDIEANVQPFSYADSITAEATLSVAPFSARSLLAALGVETPPTADPDVLENLRLDASAKLSDNDISLSELTLVIDDTTFTGKLSVPRANTGRYRVILDGDSIDITRYMAPAPAEGAEQEDAAAGQVEIPTELIRAFNVTGKFTLAEARLGDMRFTDLELGVVSTDGSMRLHPISAQLFDGSYAGDIRIDASRPKTTLSVNETIAGVSLGPLAEALYEQKNVSGSIDGNFKLSGSGEDMNAIRRDLDGTMSFTLTDGAYEGTDIWHQLRSARARFKGEQPPEPTLPPRTEFSTVGATGTVTNGVMRNDDFRAELPYLQLTGRGTVSFIEASLDYSMTARVLERPEFVGGASEAELDEFTEAVIPLTITGPLAAPKVRPDIEALLKERVEEEVKKRLLDKLLGDEPTEEGAAEGEEPKDAEDVLKDKLKDLFKR